MNSYRNTVFAISIKDKCERIVIFFIFINKYVILDYEIIKNCYGFIENIKKSITIMFF